MTAVSRVDTLPPRRLGRYVLRRELASGGMARVFLAQYEADAGFQKWVAAKVIHEHLATDRRFVDMLFDEARVTSRIQHPNVCQVLDFGGADTDTPHIVMEYIHGEQFLSVMRFGWPEGRLPLWLSTRIIADAARGLHAAHELKDNEGNSFDIVHRDVSPQNIMVDYHGVTKILDFGIARARGRIVQTGSNEIKGKFAYMAPEQLEGREIDRRADIWALAVILWEATVGRHLFRGANDGETTLNVVSKRIPPPSELVKGYPIELEEVLMRALQRNPDDRIASAAELADALDNYLWNLSLRTGPTRVARWMKNAFARKAQSREQLLFANLSTPPSALVEEFEPGDSFEEEEVTAEAPWLEGRDIDTQDSLRKRPLAGAETPVSIRLKRRRTGRWWLALAAVFVVGAVTALVSTGEPAENSEQEDRAQASEVAAASPSTTPAPVTDAPPTRVVPLPEMVLAPAKKRVAAQMPVEVQGDESADEATPDETSALSADEEATELEDETEIDPPEETPPPAETKPRVRTKPRTTPAPKKPPVVTKYGKLNLLAIPAANVYLGRKKLGRTPLIGKQLPVGTHRLRLRSKKGTKTVTVRVYENRLTKESVQFGED